MYAQCPFCSAIFRVSAQQLGAAEGQVRCGGCHEVFNAITHLRDDDYVEHAVVDALARQDDELGQAPAFEPERSPSSITGDAGSPLPGDGSQTHWSSDAVSIDPSRPSDPPAPSETADVPPGAGLADLVAGSPATRPPDSSEASAAAALAESARGFDEPAEDARPVDGEPPAGLTSIRVDASERLGQFTPPASADPVAEDELSPRAPESVAGDDVPGPYNAIGGTAMGNDVDPGAVPEAIRADLERLQRARSERRRSSLYWIGAALLALVWIAQAVWFDPLAATRSYPQWRDQVQAFCDLTGCVLPVQREPSLIRVVSRDVRVHPRYEGALQITATLVNSAPFRQPYPHMSFSLYNVNGQTIATRTFAPAEYLGAITQAGGMFEPGVPVQLALEMLAPDDVAVSFEFKFL